MSFEKSKRESATQKVALGSLLMPAMGRNSDAEEKGTEKAGRLSALRKSLRSALKLEHHVQHSSLVTSYFQINQRKYSSLNPRIPSTEKLETEFL